MATMAARCRRGLCRVRQGRRVSARSTSPALPQPTASSSRAMPLATSPAMSVSAAGDVNGDGYDDLIVGAPSGDDGGSYAGEAYVVFGKAGGFGTIDLTGLAAADGFIIQGDAAADQAGFSVSSAGDVNGDGYDDLIVGAPDGDDGGNQCRRGLCHVRQGRRVRHDRPHRPRRRPTASSSRAMQRATRPAKRLLGGRRQWRRLRRPHRRRALWRRWRQRDAGEAYVIFGKAGRVRHDRPHRPRSQPTGSSSRAMPPVTWRAGASPRRATSTATALTT